MLTPSHAYDIASQWGSYMRAGDPGAVFYSFPTADARPQNEDHRAALLAYTDSLLKYTQARIHGTSRLGKRRADLQSQFLELTELREFFATFPLAPDEFTAGYITCALWASSDNADDSGGQPLDANYSEADIAPETLARMVADCAEFQADNAGTLATAYGFAASARRTTAGMYKPANAGHDFWLTRNGHGAGFWDRDFGAAGDALAAAAKSYGTADLEVGDDKKIYLM